ncbi:MAG: hypothetical protein M5U28_51680 [Sandaracinaceae bacterium]|nr:hypothetical protein [Sandaracinaceae bacterium]
MVVSSVPSPSGSTAPPSSTMPSANISPPASSPTRPATRSSPSSTYLPPQPLKAKHTGATSPSSLRTKMGAMSRIQMSPKGTRWKTAPSPFSCARASTSRMPLGTSTSSVSPRGLSFSSRSAMASHMATNSACAAGRCSAHSSSWLGHASHTASCGSHSAGWRYPAARGVLGRLMDART